LDHRSATLILPNALAEAELVTRPTSASSTARGQSAAVQRAGWDPSALGTKRATRFDRDVLGRRCASRIVDGLNDLANAVRSIRRPRARPTT
jgi:hypothetical protein